MTTSNKVNIPHNNLEDALKEINSALEGWEKITSKPTNEQDVSIEGTGNFGSRQNGNLIGSPPENHTKEILNKLREQINELSKD